MTWLLAMLFVLGACVGSAINLFVERLCLNQGASSPWFPDPARKVPAGWLDRLPVIGWYTWRRMQSLYGVGFWVRPLFVELLTGTLFAGLYWWEVDQRALLQWFAAPVMPPGVWPAPGGIDASLVLTYQSHMILLALMLVATLIDIDERTIPDSITIPGALAGLVLAALVPWSLLPNLVLVVGVAPPVIDFFQLTSPDFWHPRFNGFPNRFSLWVGLGCYWGWCFAMLPRHWYTRHGLKRACQILFARVVREPMTWMMLVLAIIGSAGIAVGWWVGGPYWAGLLSALVGMAAGGGLVWTVRVIGHVSLGKEAMGFGDVTLMAMIGAFLGWQTSVIVFFLAPLFALLIGVGKLVLRREHEIPYGPFLCLAALTTMVLWKDVWQWASIQFFNPIVLMPIVLAACMALMPVLLLAMRVVLRLFGSGDGERD